MLAILLWGALVAPAVAQQDERFFGRWEPGSTSAGGSIMLIERNGYLTNHSPDGQNWFIEKYQVIRDFGDRVVVRASDLSLPEGDLNREVLYILHIYRDEIYLGRRVIVLHEQYCGGGDAGAYLFQDHDPDAIWRRIMEWTGRESDEFAQNRCKLTALGEKAGEGWGGTGWHRFIDE